MTALQTLMDAVDRLHEQGGHVWHVCIDPVFFQRLQEELGPDRLQQAEEPNTVTLDGLRITITDDPYTPPRSEDETVRPSEKNG